MLETAKQVDELLSDRCWQRYKRAQYKFYWWVSGLGYGVFCLWGDLVPALRGLGVTELVFLNRKGAWLLVVIALMGSTEAWIKQRQERKLWNEVFESEMKVRSDLLKRKP